ncbi:hypothetical protein [Bosea sp. BK604]|uniref:hypothetical protein n=1 Tax=Bosea sp. BK604 TaxID=2512180 RepID=UPI001052F74F|nr:hypothetical protein [Bosea sp. BK604]TCR61693.1 hypothetical protein EV560_11233 [Bosea sp. BK604]
MHDQDEKQRSEQGQSQNPPRARQSDEQRLLAIYRSLSADNQKNVMRYVEAVNDIEDIFKAKGRDH